ncbi:MAG: beta-lactamase family protein [Chloroflexi bacterium]|nr:beta-lactamase family protein [Chloroflexota bacterium]
MTAAPTSAVFPESAPHQVGINAARLELACSFIERELASGRFPGAALVVTRNQRTVLERTWGTYCSTMQRSEPYHPGVFTMLYSYSKVVSATVIVIAAQDCLIDYDLPVWHYIPEFKGGGKETVTLRHLLTHSAGIPNAPLGPVLDEEGWQRAVAVCCAHPSEWPAGSRTAYHGLSGLFMAAEVVRRVSGRQSWQEICRQRLFEPLGATLSFTPPSVTEPVALTPQPAELPCAITPTSFPLLGHPGGGCFGSLADTQRLLNLHLLKGAWNGTQLIRPEAFAEMHRVQYGAQIAEALRKDAVPQHEYWALGWLTRGRTTTGWFGFGDQASPESFGHAGIDTVMTVADPQRNLAIAFVTTDSPKPSEETTRLRNTVTNLVVAACEE